MNEIITVIIRSKISLTILFVETKLIYGVVAMIVFGIPSINNNNE